MAFLMKIGAVGSSDASKLDITRFIAVEGVKWEKNDIDAPNSGRDMNGTMHRKKVTSKDKMSITCRRLSESEHASLVAALDPDVVEVKYYSAGTATIVTKQFYNSKVQSGVVIDNGDQVVLAGITFDLTEV